MIAAAGIPTESLAAAIGHVRAAIDTREDLKQLCDAEFFRHTDSQLCFVSRMMSAEPNKQSLVQSFGLSEEQLGAFTHELELGLERAGVPPTTISDAMLNFQAISQQAGPKPRLLGDMLTGEQIQKIVNAFYRKLLGDNQTARFFEHMDMEVLRSKQGKFLEFIFSDAPHLDMAYLRSVHLPLVRHHGLKLVHFDVAVKYFTEACKEVHVDDEIMELGLKKLLSARPCFAPPTTVELQNLVPLCDRIGAGNLKAFTDRLYEHLLQDPRVTFFFNGFSVPKQKKKMVCYLSKLYGGNQNYVPKDMRVVHLPMIRDKGMCEAHFDIFMGYSEETCKELELDDEMRKMVLDPLYTLRPFFRPLSEHERSEEVGSMYARVGGAPFVKKLADVLYKHALADERLNPFFRNINIECLKGRMSGMLSFVLGHSAGYAGFDLRESHANLIKYRGLTLDLVDVFIKHFKEALEELDCTQCIVEEATHVLSAYRHEFRPFTVEERRAVTVKRSITREHRSEGGSLPDLDQPGGAALGRRVHGSTDFPSARSSVIGGNFQVGLSAHNSRSSIGLQDGAGSEDGTRPMSSSGGGKLQGSGGSEDVGQQQQQQNKHPEVVDVRMSARQFCVTC